MTSAPEAPTISLAWPLIIAALVAWEIIGRSNPSAAFFFAYPSVVAMDLVAGLLHDGLWWDTLVTLAPALAGLVVGLVVGGSVGFLLVASPGQSRRATPIIAALGAIPVFAIAPMTLVWFGLGLAAKVFLAFLSCVFVFLQAAHKGGLSVPERIAQHLSVHGFRAGDQFLKIRLPYAIDWLTASFKTGANLALLGVFVGEFVASERGLARVMLNAGALYNVKRVLSAAVLFAVVALTLMSIADFLYGRRSRLLRWVSVPRRFRA